MLSTMAKPIDHIDPRDKDKKPAAGRELTDEEVADGATEGGPPGEEAPPNSTHQGLNTGEEQ